jgi:hypothetical protein
MNCHLNRHTDTVKTVKLSVRVILLIVDANISIVLLLVELMINLIDHVLGAPAVSQPDQEGDQNNWKPRDVSSTGAKHKLRRRTRGKQAVHLK